MATLRRLMRLWRDRRGIAAVEFAIALPILTTLFFGCLEVTMNILASEKVEKLAATSADVIAQSEVATLNGLDQLLVATTEIMEPFDFGSDGVVIITSVYRGVDQPYAKVNWRHSGGGGLAATSELGTVGQQANLPDGFTLNERENVIVAEVFYQYQPMFPGVLFDERTIYRKALFKPRLSALTTPPA
ncbi:MAG: TadE/TadG family type IV pilus assembly protein [Alphaproteobacteria bacterium]